MTMLAEQVRALTGRRVRLKLTKTAGGGELEGTLSHTLESADGLVVFLTDDSGTSHTVHYQHIESVG